MAKTKTKRKSKSKKAKGTGPPHPKGGYYTCSVCGAKRKTLVAINKHYKEANHATKKHPKKQVLSRKSLEKKGIDVSLLSDTDIELGATIVQVMRDPFKMRKVIDEGLTESIRRQINKGRYRY